MALSGGSDVAYQLDRDVVAEEAGVPLTSIRVTPSL